MVSVDKIDVLKPVREWKKNSRMSKSKLKWKRRVVSGKASKGYRPRVV